MMPSCSIGRRHCVVHCVLTVSRFVVRHAIWMRFVARFFPSGQETGTLPVAE
jgi:hypothetical protein